MTNKAISHTFRLLAAFLEIHGENAFTIRSYASASRTIGTLGQQLSTMPINEIAEVKGIGKSISSTVVTLLNTGTFPLLEAMLAKTPVGVIDLVQLKGIGPKKVKVLWHELGIESLGELLYACNENRLVGLKGFGVKTQENIRQTVSYVLANANKYLYAAIEGEAVALVNELCSQKGIEKVNLTGSIRRKCPVLDCISLLVATSDVQALINILAGLTIQVEAQTPTTLVGTTALGTALVIHTTTLANFVTDLFSTTATEKHLQQVQALPTVGTALEHTEAAIYANKNLPYIVPEQREGLGEVLHPSTEALVTLADVKGLIHAHSTYSDGANTLKDMALACKTKGYQYLGITDHSKAAFYAGGLTEADIIQQHAEIDQLNATLAPFKILKGIEADILNDGSLDYNETVRASFDFVIASVHSNLKMDETKAMNRLIKAIENPDTTILGHLTSRLLLARKGYPIDHHKVIDACAANGVIIEINANPHRLDIDWRYLSYCLEKNVLLSINPDSHSIAGIDDMYYGICVARKGGLSMANTFNCWDLPTVEAYLKARKK